VSGSRGTPEDRFRRYVVEGGADECWEWTGARSTRGYGELAMPGSRPAKAHKMAWEAVNGPVPDGLWVLHHCDNPPCCNPAHLYVGTHVDNMRDMRERGRHWSRVNPERIIRGERCGAAKLTEDQVREIHRMKANGEPSVSLALRFGVTKTTVNMILRGRTWAHVLRETRPLPLWEVAS
jgi:hypothetical protein